MEKRIDYFDFLRVFATLAVMVLHITSSNWAGLDIRSHEWFVFTVGNGIVRWCVPIFVMISGALFLETEHSIGKMYQKYILRIVTAFIFWSALYATIAKKQGVLSRSFLAEFLRGHYHMWFLFMIVGIYMVVPILKKLVESEELMKYFLILAFVFAIVVPQGRRLIFYWRSGLSDVIKYDFGCSNLCLMQGYVGFFILGYYLNKVDISREKRLMIYALSILGFVATVWGTAALAWYVNKPKTVFLENFTVNVLLESIGVFVFFKYALGSVHLNEKFLRFVRLLSKYSFGAYLVHALVIEQLWRLFGINTLSFTPVVSIVIVTAIVFCVSYFVSFVLNQIPKLKKYIV